MACLAMRPKMIGNSGADPQDQAIGPLNWDDIGGLNARIGLRVTVGIIAGGRHGEIAHRRDGDGEGPAQLRQGIVNPQGKDHFQHIIPAVPRQHQWHRFDVVI